MVRLTSYSIKKGVPTPREDTFRPAQTINIVNKITNPWRVKALRPLNGLHPDVQAFIWRCKRTKFIVNDLVYYAKVHGRDINVGCYGGKHRSVAIVELVAERLRLDGVQFEIVHRDLMEEVNSGDK